MTMRFALQAWPDSGFAEMTVGVFSTEAEARKEQQARAERFTRWRFRVAEVAQN